MAIHVIRAAGAPTEAPPAVGAHWFDTVNNNEYMSFGTASVADWILSGNKISAGPITVPTVGAFVAGSVAIGGISARFNTEADFSGSYVDKAVAGITATVTANAYTYVVADFNNGTPLLRTTLDNNEVNHSTILNVAQLYWEQVGTIDELHYFLTGDYGLGLSNKTSHRLIHTERFGWESGLPLSEGAGRSVVVGSGRIWYDSQEINLLASNTATAGEGLHFYYHVGGSWTAVKNTAYNNTQYDNGTNLVSLTPNRYAVNWIFRSVSSIDHCSFAVLGNGDYTLPQAQASQPPALPPVIAKQTILVGRIIVKNGDASATAIDSAFSTFFAPGASSFAGDGEGSVQFNFLGTLGGDSSNFFWDNVNKRLGIGTNAPSHQLHVVGLSKVSGLVLGTRTVTSTPTVADTDYVLRCDATAGAFTASLPAASAGNTGRVLVYKKIDASTNAVVVGTADGITVTLTSQYHTVKVQSNGTTWDIIT